MAETPTMSLAEIMSSVRMDLEKTFMIPFPKSDIEKWMNNVVMENYKGLVKRFEQAEKEK